MEDKLEVSFETDHVLVTLQGKEDIEVASRIWSEVKTVCEKHQCFRVLGIADTSSPLDTMDSYAHVDLFDSLGFSKKYRIAWVELNPEAYEATRFTETVLNNRSFPGRLFSNEADARKWLFG